MSVPLTLYGGPATGKRILVPGGASVVIVPIAVSPKRMPTDTDPFEVDAYGFVRWVDDDLNTTFQKHEYDALTGAYRGQR